MVDPITSQVGQQAANHAAQGETSTPKGEANTHGQERFEAAMNQPVEQTNAEQQVAPTQQIDQASQQNMQTADLEEVSAPTLGEAILDGVQRMKQTRDTRAARIESQLTENTGHELTMQECMKLQFEVMQMSLEQDMTSKIADKTSQGVQTLFKNQ